MIRGRVPEGRKRKRWKDRGRDSERRISISLEALARLPCASSADMTRSYIFRSGLPPASLNFFTNVHGLDVLSVSKIRFVTNKTRI